MVPVRVMVVEDNPVMLTSLRSLLKRMPEFSVVAAARNGAEALPLIQEIRPQLLILDINMPQMNGWELLDELRAKNCSIQVIVLAGDPEYDFKERALDKGVVAYVTKSNARLFFDTLEQVIDNLKRTS